MKHPFVRYEASQDDHLYVQNSVIFDDNVCLGKTSKCDALQGYWTHGVVHVRTNTLSGNPNKKIIKAAHIIHHSSLCGNKLGRFLSRCDGHGNHNNPNVFSQRRKWMRWSEILDVDEDDLTCWKEDYFKKQEHKDLIRKISRIEQKAERLVEKAESFSASSDSEDDEEYYEQWGVWPGREFEKKDIANYMEVERKMRQEIEDLKEPTKECHFVSFLTLDENNSGTNVHPLNTHQAFRDHAEIGRFTINKKGQRYSKDGDYTIGAKLVDKVSGKAFCFVFGNAFNTVEKDSYGQVRNNTIPFIRGKETNARASERRLDKGRRETDFSEYVSYFVRDDPGFIDKGFECDEVEKAYRRIVQREIEKCTVKRKVEAESSDEDAGQRSDEKSEEEEPHYSDSAEDSEMSSRDGGQKDEDTNSEKKVESVIDEEDIEQSSNESEGTKSDDIIFYGN